MRKRINTTIKEEVYSQLRLKAFELNTDMGKLIDYMSETFIMSIKESDLKELDTKKGIGES